MKLSGKMTGQEETIKNLTGIARKHPEDVARAMTQEGEIEVTEMKRRCPVDTTEHAPHPGNLRASIHLEPVERNGKKLALTYATGAQAPYAIYVHENPDAYHPIGQWKFMESVINESAPYMMERIGNRVSFKDHKDAKSYLSKDTSLPTPTPATPVAKRRK